MGFSFFKDEITYTTKLPKGEVMKRLSNMIGERRKLSYVIRGLQKPYIGTLQSDEFRMRKVNTFRKNFRPQISGYITIKEDKTIVKVKMEIESMALVYLTMALAIIFSICYLLLEPFFTEEIYIPGYMAFIIVIGTFLLPLISYKQEAGNSKDDLEEILETEGVE